MSYEYFYPGTPNSLSPEYGDLFTGYTAPAGQIGASTGAQTANQVKDVANYLNQGMKVIELSTISQEVFDMVPKQHLKEINRLTKLTGAETTLHAPIIDPAGFTQQGWDESSQKEAENSFKEIMIRAHELNPNGNIPVTIHSSGIPGTTVVPLDSVKFPTEKERAYYEKKGGIPYQMAVINRETGEITGLKREQTYLPGQEGVKIYTPEKRLAMRNDTQWDHSISNLNFYKKEADEMIDQGILSLGPENYDKIMKGDLKLKELNEVQKEGLRRIEKAGMMLHDVESQFINFYDQAKKYIDLDKLEEERKEATVKVFHDINTNWTKEADEERERIQKLSFQGNGFIIEDSLEKSRLLDESISKLNYIKHIANAPQVYEPLESFAKEKAAETLGNVAFDTYKEFKENSPVISIENPPYGMAMSTAKELKELIEKSREQFAKKLMSENDFEKEEAEKIAKKLIGATWDTSHISMIRKQGFGTDRLIQEAKTIAPYVKHVHMNDNFGTSHTDLPPGMGNVPFKEIFKEFEKAGVDAKKIMEGGNFFQHFQTPPHTYILEAMGSPIYSMMAGPSWNQISTNYGNYFSFPSAYFPEQHFSMYGGGFSSLPQEVGGQVPGKQSRFSGAPNA